MKPTALLTSLFLTAVAAVSTPVIGAPTEEASEKATPPPPIDPNLPPEERAFKVWMRTIEEQREQTRAKNENTMRARLNELKRISELRSGQLAQFELACKGSVERATQAWLEVKEKQWQARRTGKYMRSPEQGNARLDPTQNSVWTNAISTILDNDQKDAYKAEMGARTQYQARLSILKVIAKTDRNARLSASQREALLALVEASLTIPLRDVNVRFDEATVKAAFQRVSQEKLQKLLDAEQLALWNKLTGRETQDDKEQEPQGNIQIRVDRL